MFSTKALKGFRTGLIAPAAISLIAGAIGGFVADLGLGSDSRPTLLIIALSAAYGLVLGELLMRAYGRSAPDRLTAIAALGLTIGTLGGRSIVGCLVYSSDRGYSPNAQYLPVLVSGVFSPLVLLRLAVAIAATVGRIQLALRAAAAVNR